MPKLTQHPVDSVTKLLLIGDSGSGKTGALASLAKAGYEVRILDFDAGADILVDLLKEDHPAMERVVYETFTDKLRSAQGKMVPDGMPKAFPGALDLLDSWKIKETVLPDGEVSPAYDLGKVESWGPGHVLVLDSLTLMSNAALRYVLAVNNRPMGPPQIHDWGQAMEMIEGVMAKLFSSSIKCNVIVTSHITYIGEEGAVRGYPNTLGQKLPPKLGRYFNSIILSKTQGQGASAKRILSVRSEGLIELKTPAPSRMPTKGYFDLNTGLAEFFAAVRGTTPDASPKNKAAA